MGQAQEPLKQPAPEGFCPACGEPERDGKIEHAFECPYAGDERTPEDANAVK